VHDGSVAVDGASGKNGRPWSTVSKGVAALMTAAEDAAARGCTFSVIGCRPIVLRVLDITGVRDALNVTPA